jgi:hypothetical protein
MLEFIVLGQVPGTDFQITFNTILLGCLLAIAIILLKRHLIENRPSVKLVIPQRRRLGLRPAEPELVVRDNGLAVKF